MAHSVHDPGLKRRIGESCVDASGKPLRPSADGNQDILQAPVLQIIHDRQPEFGSRRQSKQNLTFALSG